ncbi:hypothetical protein ACSS6W_001802 [Trichoderma asperelloides]
MSSHRNCDSSQHEQPLLPNTEYLHVLTPKAMEYLLSKLPQIGKELVATKMQVPPSTRATWRPSVLKAKHMLQVLRTRRLSLQGPSPASPWTRLLWLRLGSGSTDPELKAAQVRTKENSESVV